MQFVKTWKNLPSNSLDVVADCTNCNPKLFIGFASNELSAIPENSWIHNDKLYHLTMRLKDGQYSRIEDLVMELNVAAHNAFKTPSAYGQASTETIILLQADRKSNVYIPCIRHVNEISTGARKHSGIKSK